MESVLRTPQEVAEGYLANCNYKPKKKISILMIMGFLAGMFIALGASTSMVASHSITNYGVAKLITGAVFPVGLMLIIFIGAELFTGDCLMIMGVIKKDIKATEMWRTLALVWISNFLGAMVIVLIVAFSGQQDLSYGELGAYTIKAAYGKSTMDPVAAFVSGLGCNILVCAAMLMVFAAKDAAGKILAIFFTIFAFAISGFEHCVANMYYLPAGIIAASKPEYQAVAMDVYHLTEEQISMVNFTNMLGNLIPVTLGNIVGGMLFIGVPVYLLYIKKDK